MASYDCRSHRLARTAAAHLDTAEQFYSSVCGWSFQDFGPTYAAFSQSGLDGGFNADPAEKPSHPLAAIATSEIEAMVEKVTAQGGRISVPIFSFPGGRRFHFADPEGNELAVMQADTQ